MTSRQHVVDGYRDNVLDDRYANLTPLKMSVSFVKILLVDVVYSSLVLFSVLGATANINKTAYINGECVVSGNLAYL